MYFNSLVYILIMFLCSCAVCVLGGAGVHPAPHPSRILFRPLGGHPGRLGACVRSRGQGRQLPALAERLVAAAAQLPRWRVAVCGAAAVCICLRGFERGGASSAGVGEDCRGG